MLANNAAVNNQSGAALTFQGDGGLAGSGSFTNAGTLTLAGGLGTGAFDARVAFTSRGTANLPARTPHLAGDYNPAGGPAPPAGGAPPAAAAAGERPRA